MRPTILRTVTETLAWRASMAASPSIGFVPTMGALHAGHAKLLEKARSENQSVVLSLFVNPTQFNNPKDLETYPVTWDEDLALAEREGVDVIFAPTRSELYPDDYRFRVTETNLSTKFCGAHRPGHFDGVLSVVLKLFQLIAPHKAYFGEKDFQQLQLVRGMVEAFFLRLQIVSVATVRESDGLAMSSRNRLLTPEHRLLAPRLHEITQRADNCEQAKIQLSEAGFVVDYVEDFLGRRLVAASLGKVRLIDNVEI